MDVEDLLNAARAGEGWAGLALVTQLMPTLLDYADAIADDLPVGQREQAVEVAVLRSVRNLERFDPDRASFPTWVRGTLRFALADIRRQTDGGSAEVLIDSLPLWLEAPVGDSQDERVADELVWPLLKLSIADQVLIQLHHFEKLTFEECAKRIGDVTTGACRVRYHRALKRLKAELATDPNFQHLAGEKNEQ